MTHVLKISPKYFNDILYGDKRFELRKDDRDYQLMDMLELREFDGKKYTGRKIAVGPIEYILRDAADHGLVEGYCILGFRYRWPV